MSKKTALFYERYELKFHIPSSMVDDIVDFISPYCQLDHYSEISNDNYYMINNLYLDTPNYLFLQRRLAGEDNRFNMRIRSYGEELSDTCFLEIKNKANGFIKKRRAKVKGSEWFDHFKNFSYPLDENKIIHQNDYAYDFAYLLNSYRAEPKIFTQYKRKAYFSTIDDYARVTFDKELKFQHRDDYDLTRVNLNYYDVPNIFNPNTDVILELKSYTRVPFWIIDVIKYFNLERSSFSKYVNGLRGELAYQINGTPLNSREINF